MIDCNISQRIVDEAFLRYGKNDKKEVCICDYPASVDKIIDENNIIYGLTTRGKKYETTNAPNRFEDNCVPDTWYNMFVPTRQLDKK